MTEDPMERLERECKRRNWDVEVLRSLAKIAPNIAFSARKNNKVPAEPTQRAARSALREKLNREAKKLVIELRNRHRKVVIPDERTAVDAKAIAKDIADAALNKHKGNLAEVARMANIRVETLKHMKCGTAAVRFDCMLKVARVAEINIILENVPND